MKEWKDPVEIFKKLENVSEINLNFTSDFFRIFTLDDSFFLLVYTLKNNEISLFEIPNYLFNKISWLSLTDLLFTNHESVYQEAAEAVQEFQLNLKSNTYFFDAH